MFSSKSATRFSILVTTVALLSSASLNAADELPANLGGGLRQLAEWHAANAAKLAPQRRTAAVQERLKVTGKFVQSDETGRVVVDIRLDGTVAEAEVSTALVGLGATVIATVPAGAKAAAHGVVSVFLPIDAAAAAAKVPGVQSVILVHRPWRRAGTRSSQGVPAMKVSAVQRRHITGAGITIGVVSDSYDMTTPSASTNVVRDDLPGTGNRAKRTTPVNVLADGISTDSDEGRAMLQIIHDVAPDSTLAFCAVGLTQASFADAIRKLRTDATCDVIVDDIGFPQEPIFSDGIVAEAVEDVTTSTTLAGRKVLYYSAAGNGGEFGYEADFSPVSDATARAGLGNNNLQLGSVPTTLTAGGFHNFTPGAGTNIAQKVVVGTDYTEINFQWNDLFDASSITTDYNLLVFDENGNYLASYSSLDDNFSTGEAVELIDLDPNLDDGGEVTYQLVISRTSAGSGAATHFRYVVDAVGTIDGTYFDSAVPTIIGHPGAKDCDAVGAYAYNKLLEPESFSSFGPVSVYFDAAQQRLTTPEVRQQPTLSGPDGVATSMKDFTPFYGTSAAAPHVAGVAALLLQAAGGPGMLTAQQVRSTLQATALKHDLDPQASTATSTSVNGTVTLTGKGDDSSPSASLPDFFTLNFTSTNGSELKSVLIDLTASGLKFDEAAIIGFPFTVSEITGGAVLASSKLSGTRKLLLTFSAFPSGGKLTFGIDRDIARYKSGGNSGDELIKSVVTASLLPPNATKEIKQKGTFINNIGSGYSPADGFGFVNADAALKSLGF